MIAARRAGAQGVALRQGGLEKAVMAQRDAIVDYCDERLDAAAFDDYCPNGLQVEGGDSVSRIVSGVTASQALIDAATAAGADLVLVHHGYFWRGEPSPVTGMKARRLRALLTADVNLLAYHLPLDAHPELGNNRQLGLRLGLTDCVPLDGLVWGCDLDAATLPETLAARLEQDLAHRPLVVGPDRPIRRLGWCTGAAQGMIERAAAAGCDGFISGEISEQTMHQANELGITYFAAGHHATECFGVQALGQELATRFAVDHRFINLSNPA
jgi:dinuclear metal center YbgI/SA1388 family protein